MMIDAINPLMSFRGKYRVEVPENKDDKSDLISLSKDADDYGLIMEGIGLGNIFVEVDMPDEEDESFETSMRIKGLHFEKIA